MKYGGILVKEELRREGIGTVLIESCKRKFTNLKATIKKKNRGAILFFEKNGFKQVDDGNNSDDDNEECIFEWKAEDQRKAKLVYFDQDLDEKYLAENSTIPYESVNVKKIIEESSIENSELYSMKSYIKFRKKLDDIMDHEKILLYIDYNNYYKYLDDQIKELVKIKKIDLKIIICEPFAIESSKKINLFDEIETAYRKYEVIKLDCSLDMIKENTTVNQIFHRRMEILIKKINEIAENM